MARWRDLRRYFWEQVGEALALDDLTISDKGRGTSHRVVVAGQSLGFDLSAGRYWEGSGQESVAYMFAAVSVTGLPQGLGIDRQLGFSTAERVSLSCETGRVRTVTLEAVPIQLGELRVEQVALDLEAFLTPQRRDVICSMVSDLRWMGEMHQLEQRIPNEPYPKKRVLTRAMSGDPEAARTMWEHRDRVVELANSVLGDARTAKAELGGFLPEDTAR